MDTAMDPAAGTVPMTDTVLRTPNIGSGVSEERDRVDFTALRRDRRRRVFDWMEATSIDVLLLGREANVRYLTGARRLWTSLSRPFGPTCIAVRSPGEVHMLSFSASYEGMPAELSPDDIYAVTWNPMNLIDHLTGMAGVTDARRIGVDDLNPLFDGLLRATLPGAELVGVQPGLLDLRRVKLEAELDCLSVAAAIAESALLHALDSARPGRSGKDLQAAYLARMCELGTSQFAQQGAFGVVGPDGALPVATGDVALPDDAAVVASGGVLWAGYEGSLARTWWNGHHAAPQVLRDLHARYAATLESVRQTCRPGTTGADLYRVLAAAGADPIHSALYSVGLGHEGPLAAAWLDDKAMARQRVGERAALCARVVLRSQGHTYLGEDMLVVRPGATEVLTTLGYGPLGS